MSNQAIEDLAGEIGGLLRGRGETLAIAESCTGGLLAAALTEIPGSSDYLWGGAVVYTSDAKAVLAGIDPALIGDHGVVSAETTAALADGVRRRAGATYGLAVTGWAGPAAEPPEALGIVYVALADASSIDSERKRFDGDRRSVRRQACAAALDRLRARLLRSDDDNDTRADDA